MTKAPATERNPRQVIALIDREIDATTDEVIRREGRRPEGAEGWDAAWKRYPELSIWFHAMYAQRGIFQAKRDALENSAWAREQRTRARKAIQRSHLRTCPTCGFKTLRSADARKAA